jgi:GntR family transcriptional regulator
MPPQSWHHRGIAGIGIDLTDGVPIYRQIVNHMRYLVASGRLEAEDALPSISTLAHELDVAPNTVARAYEELAAVGLVHKRQGFGTYVSLTCAPTVDRERQDMIEQRIDALLADARLLNLSLEALIDLMHRRQAIMASKQVAAS